MTATTGGSVIIGAAGFTANTAQGAINFGANGVLFGNGTGGSNILSTALQGTGKLAVSVSPAISAALVLNTGTTSSAPTNVNFVLNSGTVNLVANGSGSGAVVGANFGIGTLTLVGGIVNSNTGATLFNIPNPIVLAGLVTIGNALSTDSFAFNGPITLATNSVIRANNATFFNGVVGESGGSHSLNTTAGSNTLTLNNVNSYSGGTNLFGGTLAVGQGTSLSSGTVTFAGGILVAAAKVTISNAISIPNTTAVIAGNTSLTLGGTITLLGQGNLLVTNTGVTTVSGSIAGNGVLTTNSSTGNLLLNPSSNTSAGTYLNGGTILVGNATAFGATAPVLLGTSTVIGTSALTISNPLVLTGGTTFSGSNALTFTGNATLVSTVAGFGGTGAGWQVNNSGISTPPISNDVLTLTDLNNNEARSAFLSTQVPTGGNFTASFTYTRTGGSIPPADGFAFVLQQQAVTALGGTGGGKGYSGITPSVGVLFNIYTGGGGIVGTTVQINGANPADSAYSPSAPVNLASGDPIGVTINYNASLPALTITMTDLVNFSTSSITYNVNIATALGGNPAFVGFTGGTGGANTLQTISNFSFTTTAAGNTNALNVNNSTTFSGIIGESGGARNLTAIGVGTLTLSNAANVYSGGTTLNSGPAGAPTETLVVGSATALGSGTLALTSGTLQVAGAFAIPNAITFGTGGEVVFGGNNPITFTNSDTNALTNATPSALVANTPTTINAVLSGSGGLVFLGGSSSFTLTGANTYTGTTVVSGGTLTLGGASGALAATAPHDQPWRHTAIRQQPQQQYDLANNVAAVTLNGGTLYFLGSSNGPRPARHSARLPSVLELRRLPRKAAADGA